MNVALRQRWTIERFLAWEALQELRYEFDGEQPVAMTGGTVAHDTIQVNLVTALNTRVRGKPCRVHGNGLKISVRGSLRYPDAFVSCTPADRDATVLAEPVVIFEVPSRSTARTDRMVKNREYAATASVQRYVMLEQSAVEGMMFTRTGPDGAWVGRILDADAVLHMPEIGLDVPIAEFYAGLDMAHSPAEDEASD
jgi:Uma2 family endonuclease